MEKSTEIEGARLEGGRSEEARSEGARADGASAGTAGDRRRYAPIAGTLAVVALAAFIALGAYFSGAFRSDPTVESRANNVYAATLRVVTDIDYEPYSYLDENGEYAGLDVELINEIANRLEMNLDFELLDWSEANRRFLDGRADAILNMETDSVVSSDSMIATIPTAEKQYVVYGREHVASVAELYGRKVASLHHLPELGLDDYITYADSYAEMFAGLKSGEYEFAICPIQVGMAFVQKLDIPDVKVSYAVGHVYGAIALHPNDVELRERLNAVIAQLQAEGYLDALDDKWITQRYVNTSVLGMVEAHPLIAVAALAVALLVAILAVILILQRQRALEKDRNALQLLMWDSTTGLSSKEFFYRNVGEALGSDPGARFDMICCDIQNFKVLNDRYGAARCDAILHDLAVSLREAIPNLAEGGRIGGDVFAFLAPHREGAWDEVRHAGPWDDTLTAAVANVPPANLSVKFGIVQDVPHDVSAQLVCDRALFALEEVKDAASVAVGYYDSVMLERQRTERIILDSAESALANREFALYFQPKHDVRADHAVGAEALVRWIHPELGFVNPGLFITLFERNSLITSLDLYIWEEACREIRRCQDLGLPQVAISVNASRLDFDVPDLADRIAEFADRYGVDHGLLHIELTETAYSDNPGQIARALADLKAKGFKVELDDFGAGFSSLASLNTLPLDVMKLDMSVLRQATELNDYRIVESAIKLAQLLGLESVIEGVETAEEAAIVKDLGCDLIQGYFYSKPLDREHFEEYLAAEREG